jgi:MFS transporter, ACS family, pantothenate transporter
LDNGYAYPLSTIPWLNAHTALTQPSNFILTRVPAHIWIPFLEIGWTVFTFSLAGAKTYHQMLGLRFVVGLFEAGYWPALYYILGSWYNKRELGKRNGILQSAVSIAPIFSGFLQAGIYTSLNGHAGLAGWRWLFGKFLKHSLRIKCLTRCYSHQRCHLSPNRHPRLLLLARHTWHRQTQLAVLRTRK